jgi:peptidylglycine monooxygenase
MKMGPPPSVGVDSEDNVYAVLRRDAVADPEPRPAVVVFDKDGNFVRAFGGGLVADGHGIFVTADGRVLLCDRDAHQVLAFDRDGHLLFTLGQRHRPLEPFNHPTDVAVAPSGDIYVSDGYANWKVHRFSSAGEPKGSFGKPGRGPGCFGNPHAVWALADGRVLVADRENSRVQVFAADGAFLAEWPDVYRPADIYADAQGLVYVSDETPKLSLFKDDGTLIGRCRPSLNTPHGIYGDSRGNIFVAELNPPRLAKLARVA